MENLSKALGLIATILIVMMIIGLAMRVFNSIRGSAIYSVMDEQNLRAYNRPFDIYDGKNNVSGSNLKTLFNQIIEHNKGYQKDNSMWINVKLIQEEDDFDDSLHSNGAQDWGEDIAVEEYNAGIYMLMKTVWTTSKYEVFCSYDTISGRIVCVQYKKR